MKLKTKRHSNYEGYYIYDPVTTKIHGEKISPELAEWIRVAAVTLECECTSFEFGQPLTEDCEIEI